MGAHALLSASDAKRWLNCPAAVRVTETMKEQTSVNAQEGTLAHAIAEQLLKKEFKLDSARRISAELAKLRKHGLYKVEMEKDYLVDYVSQVSEIASLHDNPIILLEQRLDYSAYAQEGFGTGDVLIISDGRVDVIDLKYGKGVRVDAEENPQLMLYGLGALELASEIYTINDIVMHIIMPRLDYVSEYYVTAEELRAYGDCVVKPAAELAFAGGNGVFVSGEHCRWCKIKATCMQRAKDCDIKELPLLADTDIADILRRKSATETWLKDVSEYACKQALEGTKYEGFKLVEASKNRCVPDPEVLIARLKGQGVDKKQYLEEKLLGVGKLEKNFGKAITLDWFVKPKGEPVLVPESDKRPEIIVSSVEEDFDILT